MSELLFEYDRVPFLPTLYKDRLRFWIDANDESTLTFNFQSITETATGTINTNTITASADVSAKIDVGNRIQVAGTDLYTVTNVATDTITTQEPLVASYSADTIEVGHIAQWDDKSGQGSDAIQATALDQPLFVASQINGKPTIRFNGISQFLDIPGYSNAAAWTLFGVIESPTIPANAVSTGPIHKTANMQISWDSNSAAFRGATALSVSSTFHAALFTPAITANVPNILSGSYDTETLLSRIDGSETLNTTPSGNADNEGLNLNLAKQPGTTRFWDGDISEVIIFDRALSANEHTTVENYLNNKWSIF